MRLHHEHGILGIAEREDDVWIEGAQRLDALVELVDELALAAPVALVLRRTQLVAEAPPFEPTEAVGKAPRLSLPELPKLSWPSYRTATRRTLIPGFLLAL